MIFNLPEKFINPAFLALLVIILVGIFIPLASIPQKLATPSVNFETISYPSQVWQERVLKNAQSAASERDVNKRFEFYSLVFRDLAAIYTRNHEAQAREQLESLVSFIAEEFPNQYKAGNFNIPCLDLACGTANYPAEIEEIKSQLRSIEAIEPLVLESVLKKFEAAALATDTNFQWGNYFNAFQEIKSEAGRAKEEKITQTATMLRDFLQRNYQGNYSEVKRLSPKSIEI